MSNRYTVIQVGQFSADEQFPDTFELEGLGEVSVVRCSSFEEFEARVDLPQQCVVLIDSGSEALRTLVYAKSKRPQLPVLMLLDHSDVDCLCEALDRGLDAHVCRMGSWKTTSRVLRKVIGRWLKATLPRGSVRGKQAGRPAIEVDAFWTFFEAAPVGIKILDSNNVILYGNRAVQEMLEYTQDELRLLTEHQLIAASDSELARASFERIAAGETDFSEIAVDHVTSSGEVVPTLLGRLALRDDEGQLRYVIESIVQIDEAAEFAERSSSSAHGLVRELAAGIAHDLRNILSMITIGTESLRLAGTKNAAVTRTLEQIVEAANRGSRIAERISQLGRRDVSRKRVDLVDYISDFYELLDAMLPDAVQKSVVSGVDSVHVEAGLGQLDQIVLNLVSNAAEAMDGAGQLVIKTDRVVVDSDHPEAQPLLRAGDYAVLRISDSGRGMDEETASRIFEPYFSTKQGDNNSGLGLANVYRAVRELGGSIVVSSQPGQGSTFSIFLPLAD